MNEKEYDELVITKEIEPIAKIDTARERIKNRLEELKIAEEDMVMIIKSIYTIECYAMMLGEFIKEKEEKKLKKQEKWRKIRRELRRIYDEDSSF